jgi:GTP diphosphokinase / guanosine-3',5'-bis(diphosphate) 3'-diphosphatase
MNYFLSLQNKVLQNKSLNIEKIEAAYIFAEHAHQGQKRKSGEDYIIHPVMVAEMVCEAQGDQESIIAALLHDTVEDTKTTFKTIEDLFGSHVTFLVKGLTKVKQTKTFEQENLVAKIESLRKWLEVMRTDLRVGIIKIYDRLHNMRTLSAFPSLEKQKSIAQETLDVFARIADKLAMNVVKKELEGLSLMYINRKEFDCLETIRKKHRRDGLHILPFVQQQLVGADYQSRICNIAYAEYSLLELKENNIHIKKKTKGILSFIIDITTYSIEDCYYILFLIHSQWREKKGFFEDAISTPMANGCQELQTTVLYRDGNSLLFRIRTQEMLRYYEAGISLFCFSKQNTCKHMPWLKNISYVTKIDTLHSHNFLKTLHNNILGNFITLYTSFDEPFLLPKNSTALDAAFFIYEKKAWYIENIFIDGALVKFDAIIKNNAYIYFEFAKNIEVSKQWKNYCQTALGYFLIEKGLTK